MLCEFAFLHATAGRLLLLPKLLWRVAVKEGVYLYPENSEIRTLWKNSSSTTGTASLELLQ